MTVTVTMMTVAVHIYDDGDDHDGDDDHHGVYCAVAPHIGQMQPKPWAADGHASITTDQDDADLCCHDHYYHGHCHDYHPNLG